MRESGETSEFSLRRTLSRYTRPYRAKLFLGMAAAAVAGSCVSLQAVIVKYLVDNGINRPNADLREKTIWTFIFIGVYLGFSLTRVFSFLLALRISVAIIERILFTIRSSLFRHVQRLGYGFLNSNPTGELLNYLIGAPLRSLQLFLRQFGTMLPALVVTWLVSLAVLISFDPIMTFVAVIPTCVIAYVNYHSVKTMKRCANNYMGVETTASKHVADLLRGSHAITLHGAEENVCKRFDRHIGRMRNESINLQYKQNVEHIKPELLNYLTMGIVYGFGSWSCLYRGMSVGTFMAFAVSLQQLMMPLIQLFQLNLLGANATAGLARIENILAEKERISAPQPDMELSVGECADKAVTAGIPEVVFRDVTFSHDDTTPALAQINCSIERNKMYALVGPTGGGKSTFARLLMRLYDPQSGSIYLNGADIRGYPLQPLRQYFGVVPQEPFLFQTSIRENIRIARPEASDDEVRDALERAGADRFINRLTRGWDTEVAENGSSFSGGQRQCLAIARALLSDATFIIFDEATAAMDGISERNVQEVLEGLRKTHTIMVIAHRLSNVREVDSILVFEAGRIVQTGTYADLKQREGLFRDLAGCV